MKTISKILIVVILLTGLLWTIGCNDDDNSSPLLQQVQLKQLSKSWTLTSVKLDGSDNTDYYSDFAISITGKDPSSFSYTTTGRPHYSCWPASGSFAFGQNAQTMLMRDKGTDDQLLISYKVTDSTLELRFMYSGTPYGARTANVEGEWVFLFEL